MIMSVRAIFLLLLAAPLFLFSLPAFAQEVEVEDSSSSEVEETEDRVTEREWTVATDEADRARVEGSTRAGELEDEIDFEFRQRDNGHEILLEYSHSLGETEEELDFRFRSFRLIEYLPSDSATSVAFDAATSTVVSDMVLGNWQDMTSVITGNPMTFTSTTTLGVFSVTARVTQTELVDGASTLTPNAVKTDVTITSYPYTDTTNMSHLALECAMRFRTQVETETDETEGDNEYNVIEVAGGAASTIFGSLDWMKTATIDGAEQDVFSSSFATLVAGDDAEDDEATEDESECKIYYSFNAVQPADIFWDPEIGVNYMAANAASSVLPSAVSSLFLLVVGLFALN